MEYCQKQGAIQIGNEKLGVNRAKIVKEVEASAIADTPIHQIPVFGNQG